MNNAGISAGSSEGGDELERGALASSAVGQGSLVGVSDHQGRQESPLKGTAAPWKQKRTSQEHPWAPGWLSQLSD